MLNTTMEKFGFNVEEHLLVTEYTKSTKDSTIELRIENWLVGTISVIFILAFIFILVIGTVFQILISGGEVELENVHGYILVILILYWISLLQALTHFLLELKRAVKLKITKDE